MGERLPDTVLSSATAARSNQKISSVRSDAGDVACVIAFTER